ncbi:MAG: hypothetical protein LBQ88_00470 [Treponema sp.]|nr:hypothetical protein [Treponema sp.]
MTNELKNRLSKVMTLDNKLAPAWETARPPSWKPGQRCLVSQAARRRRVK